jgi:hypothetical protein
MADALEDFATRMPPGDTIRNRHLDSAVDGTIVHNLHFKKPPEVALSDSDLEGEAEVEDDQEAGQSECSTDNEEDHHAARANYNTSSDSEDGNVQVHMCTVTS